MKLKTNFEIVDMGDEIIAVPVGEGSEKIRGVLKLNKAGAELLEYITKGMLEGDIVDALSKKYDNDRSTLMSDVQEMIIALKDAGLLV